MLASGFDHRFYLFNFYLIWAWWFMTHGSNLELHLHYRGQSNVPMLTLCLVALGLSITTLALAFRKVDEGYQDEVGFHNGPRTGSDAR